MKNISLWFSGFWPGFSYENNFFTSLLSKKYAVTISKENPDFLIYSVHTTEDLNYTCTKIFFTGENISPNYNLCDYSIDFEYSGLEDRHFRLPFYRLYLQDADRIVHSEEFFETEAASKEKFCNFLYSNSQFADPHRLQFFDTLSQYKPVDSGGDAKNNIGYKVVDKLAWLRQYKFTIAFENSSKPGYTTEKIFDALRTHTVPIYWGNPHICREINPKRFINVHDYPDWAAVVEKVKEIDTNPEQYLAMISEPWFVDGIPPRIEEDPQLAAFLYYIVDQGPTESRRVVPYGWNIHYQARMRHAFGLVEKFRGYRKSLRKCLSAPVYDRLKSFYKALKK